MNVLGIETSCDETAATVVTDGHEVRSSIVASQIELHKKFAGVVPEIASQAHVECLDAIIAEALEVAGVRLADIDAIAVTNRPGLVGCLLIGLTAAKTLAWSTGKPLITVNHVHAHATSPALGLDQPPWPAAALVVSGGHTSLYYVADFDGIELMGATTDDACGEAFDKVASILGLGYPGGPAVEKAAEKGNSQAVCFPRSMLDKDSLDFSFSGIKTAVLYHVHGPGKTSGGLEKLSRQQIADIAASFQAAVFDVLVAKTLLATEKAGVKTVMAGGGVMANSLLRTRLQSSCCQAGVTLYLADPVYCTDNAAMIAAHGYQLIRRGQTSHLDEDAHASEKQETNFSVSA